MNRDCRQGTPAVRVRLLLAVLALLAVAGMVLAGSRSRTAVSSLPPSASESSMAAVLPQPHIGTLDPQRSHSMLASLPMIFEPNQGQAGLDPSDARAKFVARGPGYGLFLGSEGAILTLQSQVAASKATRVESLSMKLAGANLNTILSSADPLPGKSNYLLGNDVSRWRRNIPQFARVRYQDVYPGINLVFYGKQNQLEYDFQVAPGADPAQAELEFSGAKHLALHNGDLIIEAKHGAVRFQGPHIYQEVAGHQQPVAGSFVLRADNRVGFAIGAYDRSRELVIDPILSYATYFGGAGNELNNYVAVDNVGNIYLAGSTTTNNLPTTAGVFQPAFVTGATQNVYVAKINPGSSLTGSAQLVYLTYLGGSGSDYPVGIAVDNGNNPYLAGTTTSPDFPTTSTGYQTAPESTNAHVFVSRFNNTVSALSYSSYLSGDGVDIASGMTIDANSNLYVTGTTTSINEATSDQFPATNLPQQLPYQTYSKLQGQPQFFVTKVFTGAQRNGSIAYSTYFGGGDFNAEAPNTGPTVIGGGIAVDTNGNIYFTGTTNYTYSGTSPTTDFPILDAYQPCLDMVPAIQVTNPQTCTNTTSNTALQYSDAFAAKLNPNAVQGAQLIWSTYLGGALDDFGNGIALNSGAASVYVAGTTDSFPFTNQTNFAPYQACLNNNFSTSNTLAGCATSNTTNTDAFVATISNPATTTSTTDLSLTYFSYVGGADNEKGLAVAVDYANGAIVTGWTNSPSIPNSAGTGTLAGSFPVSPYPNAVQSQLSGTQDAFIARLNSLAQTGQTNGSYANYYGQSGTSEGTSIALDNNQDVYIAGDTNGTIETDNPYQSTPGGGSDAFVAEFGTASQLSVTGVLTLGTNQVYIPAGNQATFTYTITNNGPDVANNIQFSDQLPTNSVTMTPNSISASGGTCSTASGSSGSLTCSIPSLQSGATATVTVVLTPSANTQGNSAQFTGGTVTVFAANAARVQTTVSGIMSDFTITAGPSSYTVAAGSTAVYQVQLTPQPVYGTSVTLSATGLPTGASAAFSTQSVTMPTVSPASSILSISTTARPVTTPITSLFRRSYYAFWFAVPGIVLFFSRNQKRRRMLSMLTLCVLAVMIGSLPACTKQSTTPPVSGTPAGTYPITIAATSGSDTKSYAITLIVQ